MPSIFDLNKLIPVRKVPVRKDANPKDYEKQLNPVIKKFNKQNKLPNYVDQADLLKLCVQRPDIAFYFLKNLKPSLQDQAVNILHVGKGSEQEKINGSSYMQNVFNPTKLPSTVSAFQINLAKLIFPIHQRLEMTKHAKQIADIEIFRKKDVDINARDILKVSLQKYDKTSNNRSKSVEILPSSLANEFNQIDKLSTVLSSKKAQEICLSVPKKAAILIRALDPKKQIEFIDLVNLQDKELFIQEMSKTAPNQEDRKFLINMLRDIKDDQKNITQIIPLTTSIQQNLLKVSQFLEKVKSKISELENQHKDAGSLRTIKTNLTKIYNVIENINWSRDSRLTSTNMANMEKQLAQFGKEILDINVSAPNKTSFSSFFSFFGKSEKQNSLESEAKDLVHQLSRNLVNLSEDIKKRDGIAVSKEEDARIEPQVTTIPPPGMM